MRVVDHTWYRKPDDAPIATSSGGVVARAENGRVKIALVRERGGGMYVLPKGHVEAGETLEQAARREIEEEAGVKQLRLIEKLGVLERLDYDKTEWKVIHYFLFDTTQVHATPTDVSVAHVMGWFPIDQLPPMFWPEQKALIETKRERIMALVRARAAGA